MDIKKIMSYYSFICEKYFFISLSLIMSILIIEFYTGCKINPLSFFYYDNFNVLEVSTYLIGSTIMCFVHHTIINRLLVKSFKVFSFLWIVPLIIKSFSVLTVLIGYYF